MSVTKHKIFKLKLSDDGNFNLTQQVENTIDDFLVNPNNVYINHSITTLSEDIETYGNYKSVCKLLLISLVYKDLNSSPLNVETASQKVKKVVHKQIVLGENIAEPQIETEIDKEIKLLTVVKKV